jgi:hypothetical protein
MITPTRLFEHNTEITQKAPTHSRGFALRAE